MAEGAVAPEELPVCRPAPISLLEYYYSSNETARSALGGRIRRDDNSTEHEQMEDRLRVSADGLAVFFGGCGDARHLLHTLKDVQAQLLSWSQEKRESCPIVMTLNDHNARTLARVVVLLRLFADVGALVRRQDSTLQVLG